MKKVIIFTASTGGGHDQAAKSLEKEFSLHGYEATVVDFLKITSKMMERLFVDGYDLLYSSLPKIYKGLYKYSNNYIINKRLSKSINKIFEKRIYKFIEEKRPDIIIGTHPFIVNVICTLKKKNKIRIPFISVITDFKAHIIYVNDNVDAYITGSDYTSEDMIKKGICKNKVYSYGIPVRQEFFDTNNLRILDKNKPLTILLMGGSMGIKGIKKVLKGLVNCKNKIRLIVVCGRNKSLMEYIEKKYKNKYSDKEIVVYGFTQEISNLMAEADLLISKPGGLTTSEAIVKRLPMLIPYMIPGQEEENAEFLVKSGAAKVINNVRKIQYIVDELIENPEELRLMREKIEDLAINYSLDSIVRLGDKLIIDYKNNYRYDIRNAR